MSQNQKTVLYSVEDTVATIQMNRPHVKNALNENMLHELYAAFQEANKDDKIAVIALTGTDKAFSSGADLKSIPVHQLADFDHGEYLSKHYNPLILLINESHKPTIACINGVAVGAGLSLALACDFRVAADDAVFALSFLNIGLIPDAGTSYFLPRLVGLGKALELGLGDKLTTAEALRIGLIHQRGDGKALIDSLKKLPYPAYSWMKANMKAGTQLSLCEVMQLEVEGQRKAGASTYHRQAILQFLNGKK